MSAKKRFNEQQYLKKLSDLKWNGKKFACKSCGGEQYKQLANYSRRCKNVACRHTESATTGTALEGMHISVEKTMKIFKHYQDVYREFREYIYEWMPRKEGEEYAKGITVFEQRVYLNVYLYDKGKLDLSDHPARASSYDVSIKFHVQQKTIIRLIDRVSNWLTPKMHKDSVQFEEWYSGIEKSKRSSYSAFYNLLFDEEEDPEIEGEYYRSEDEILYILVNKKLPKIYRRASFYLE